MTQDEFLQAQKDGKIKVIKEEAKKEEKEVNSELEKMTQLQNINDKDPIIIVVSVPGANALTASNYGVFFTALFPIEILEVSEVHGVASGGTTATLDIEKLTGNQALDAGATVLDSAINLRGTANTVGYPKLSATPNNRILKKGERLALKDGGTITLLSDVQITIKIRPLGKGYYR